MPLKYAAHFAARPDQPCPCTGKHTRRRVVGFHFMHNPAQENPDFVPPAFHDGNQPKPRDKCGRLALSFFISVDAARTKYAVLSERMDAEARYGAYIGEVSLLEGDGLLGAPNAEGHMNLHQEDDVLFASRVTNYFLANPHRTSVP